MLEKIKNYVSCVFFVIMVTACSSESHVFFQTNLDLVKNQSFVEDAQSVINLSEEILPMKALNSNGKKGSILHPEKSAYIYLAVNQEQLPQVARAKELWGGLSCQITLMSPSVQKKSKNTPAQSLTEGELAFGFLYQSDFDVSGKLKDSLAGRPLARCSTPVELGQLPSGETITLSMVIPSESVNDFRGMLVYSTIPISIAALELKPIEVGFSGTDSYSFSSQGGLWDRSQAPLDFDFTPAKKDFEVATTDERLPFLSLRKHAASCAPSSTDIIEKSRPYQVQGKGA